MGDTDPADRTAAAHTSAALLVRLGRAARDPSVTERLVRLVDQVGLDEIADLWRDAASDTLPGTLWSLYLLRTWVRTNPAEAARLYDAGRSIAEVANVVAGVAEPPGPEEVAAVVDAVLTSAFDGDFAIALERAGAFCRVVAAGRARLADELDDAEDQSAGDRQTRLAAGNLRMAEQLDAAARLWRAGRLT